jgi:hypothetical protein
MKLWTACDICKKPFTGQVQVDLIEKFVESVEKKYPELNWRRLVAYNSKLNLMDDDELARKSLAICDKLHETDCPREWIDVLKSNTYFAIGKAKVHCGLLINDESIAKQGIALLEKAAKHMPSEIEDVVSSSTNECNEKWGRSRFGKAESVEESLERLRLSYEANEFSLPRGRDNEGSIITGHFYARALVEASHSIEAWRLLDKLIPQSQQTHGSEHTITLQLKEFRDMIHVVNVKNQGSGGFQALRYEGDQCVVRGPIECPRIYSKEKVLKVTVHDNNVVFFVGTPVICHGLKNASHLNGRIGDVRSFSNKTKRYGVHFEDKSIPPKSVKPENLRILFELPERNDV